MLGDELRDLKNKLSTAEGIIGKEKRYFNSVVLIPLVKLNSKYQLLFQRRAEGIPQANEICFPGGKYEKEIDQNYQAAAIRETEEELGIESDRINPFGKLGTMIVPLGLTVDAFIAYLDITSLKDLELNYEEVIEVFTIPLEYFKHNPPQKHSILIKMFPYDIDQAGEKKTLLPVEKLDLPEKYATPWKGNQRNIFVYPTKNGIIWGITAELIVELINKIEDDKFT